MQTNILLLHYMQLQFCVFSFLLGNANKVAVGTQRPQETTMEIKHKPIIYIRHPTAFLSPPLGLVFNTL